MGKLAELWRSPYPTFYQRWKAVVIPSAIIFLILYILQPFGISRIKGSVFGVVAGSALIAAGAPMYNRNAERLYLGISRNSYLLNKG